MHVCTHMQNIISKKVLYIKLFSQSRDFFKVGNTFPTLFSAESLFVDGVLPVKIRGVRKGKRFT